MNSVNNLYGKTKQEFDVAHHCWATEKNFHFWDAKNAISSFNLNEFAEKFNETY